MQIEELKAIWRDDAKMKEKLTINLHCLNEIQTQEVRSNLTPLLRRRIVEAVSHGITLILLMVFLFRNISFIPYLLSTGALIAFYGILFSSSIKQIQLIKSMDYSRDIIFIQKSLATLQVHSLHFMRLLFLFLPVVLGLPMIVSKAIHDYNLSWLSFLDFSQSFKGNWWNVQLMATAIWGPVCIWLYRKVSAKNIHIPWVKNLIENAAGKKVAKAVKYLDDLRAK
jgi:hypothetical protein